jgi:hypothetical protein
MSHHTDELTLSGVKSRVGGEDCTVLVRDWRGDVLHATGTTVPTDDAEGFAKGCLFVDSDAPAGTSGLYVNIGTRAACNFNLATIVADA